MDFGRVRFCTFAGSRFVMLADLILLWAAFDGQSFFLGNSFEDPFEDRIDHSTPARDPSPTVSLSCLSNSRKVAQPLRCRVSGAIGANDYTLTPRGWNKNQKSNY